MLKTISLTLASIALTLVPAGAQQNQRRASLNGNGNPNEGRCTVEVVVDGAVDLEFRNDSGVLRDLSGQPPQWRRFECSGRMPDNPGNFQVRTIGGRGTVQLTRNPRDGGIAVIRIEDPESGADVYTLEFAWTGGQSSDYNNGPRYNNSGIGDNSNQRRDTMNQQIAQGRANGPFNPEQAVGVCQEGARQEAARRFGSEPIRFRNANMDSSPDRREWVVGAFDVRTRDGRDEAYRFSCSVDFADGRVRSVQIDPMGADPYASSGADVANRLAPPRNAAIETCQEAVNARIQRSGYDSVSFDSISKDRRPGRSDWVVGKATGDRGNRSDRFNFSCRVNPSSGDVRSVTVTRR